MFNALNRTARPATYAEEANHLENEMEMLAGEIEGFEAEEIEEAYAHMLRAKAQMARAQKKAAALERAETRALAFEVAKIKTKRALSYFKLPRVRVEWK